jgi:hypothetical protein
MRLFRNAKKKKKKKRTIREDVVKRIMPNKCELCTVSIGTSMLFYNNAWRPFKSPYKKVHYFYYETGRIKVCSDCYKKLSKMENPAKYIEENVFKG